MTQLLGPPNSTNFFLLRFPIICGKISRGENIFCLDHSLIRQYFDLSPINIDKMSIALCDNRTPIRSFDQRPVPKDPVARAVEYRSLIDKGIVKNQSELASYPGTSRPGLSKVLKVLRRPVD